MAKKQKNIKKQSKTNKQKFGLRKLDFKKNWKKLSYLGLAGFLALTSVGFGTWKSFDQSADAVGWTTVKYSLINKSWTINNYNGLINHSVSTKTTMRICVTAKAGTGQSNVPFSLDPSPFNTNFTASAVSYKTYCSRAATTSGSYYFGLIVYRGSLSYQPTIYVRDAYLQYYYN